MKIKYSPSIPKWKITLFEQAFGDASKFIRKKYKLSLIAFHDLLKGYVIKINPKQKPSIYIEGKLITIAGDRWNFIYLYERKSIGNYHRVNKVSHHHGFASQLIHELTHLIQHIEKRKYSEVETTRNEIEYLESQNYKVFI